MRLSSWHVVSLKLICPYPYINIEKTNILVVKDVFTKWVEAFPIAE